MTTVMFYFAMPLKTLHSVMWTEHDALLIGEAVQESQSTAVESTVYTDSR